MQTVQYASKILEGLQQTINRISEVEAEQLVNGILEAKKIFVAGSGRSGFMGKSFAMRMMHMGLDPYMVGETVTPNLEKEDMLIIISGSGETKSLVSMAQKAKQIGAKVALVTIFPNSTIGKLANIIVKLSGAPKDQTENSYTTIQPMGSLFEQTVLLFLDSTILRVMEKKGLTSTTMFNRHANLE